MALRVVISAYACEPGKGSEPYVGWTWVHAIAQVADEVHVITRANNRESIEHALSDHQLGNVRFHYFDLPQWTRFWKRGQRGVQIYYYLWQYALGRYALHLHERYQFDVAHHVTFAGAQYPPGIALLPIPFIWGPIGWVQTPPSLRKHIHLKAQISERTHDLLYWMCQLDPIVTYAFQTAKLVLVFPNSKLPQLPKGKILRVGHMFINSNTFSLSKSFNKMNSLHIISAFRMIYWKGGDLGIEALALLKNRNIKVHWTLIGDGPELSRWKAMARYLGVVDMLEFCGHLPRDKVLHIMSQGDILLHPAFREGFSGAVLEGMSCGLPVVCLDWGGPGQIVDDECGIKVSVNQTWEKIVEGISDAIERLQDPALRRLMSEAARERVRKYFSLETLISIVERVYNEVQL